MSKLYLRPLEEHLSVTDRDGFWAYKTNQLTMFLIQDLLSRMPPAKHVKEDIIPLLEKAHNLVLETPHKGQYGDLVDHFADCINLRLNRDINSYFELRESIDNLFSSEPFQEPPRAYSGVYNLFSKIKSSLSKVFN